MITRVWSPVGTMLCVVCLTACGSSSKKAAVTSACSFDAKERPALARKLDDYVNDYSVPGAVEVVCAPDGTTDAVAGFSNLRDKVEMRPTDRFAVGGLTETLVSTVALQLVGEGLLRLGDTVERWLPGVVPRGREITVRQLLNHTSGIPSYFDDRRVQRELDANPDAVIPTQVLIARAVSHPLKFEPGSNTDYSITDYLLVGSIIRKATGRSVGAEFERRIFAPLDLSHTSLVRARQGSGAPEIRGYDVTGSRPRDVTDQRLGRPSPYLDVISDGDDLVRFFSALLGGKLLRPHEQQALKSVTPPTRTNGLGLYRITGFNLCRQAWISSSFLPGYRIQVIASDDGTRVVLVAANGVSNAASRSLQETAADAFCAA